MLKFPDYSNLQSGLRSLCIGYGFASTVLYTRKRRISFNEWYPSCTLWCVKQELMIFPRNSFYTMRKTSNGK